MQTLVIRRQQYTNNNLYIWAGTLQQLKPITADFLQATRHVGILGLERLRGITS